MEYYNVFDRFMYCSNLLGSPWHQLISLQYENELAETRLSFVIHRSGQRIQIYHESYVFVVGKCR